MELPFRIGNVELRQAETLAWKNKESKYYYDIVFWYPNSYYGKEDEFDYDARKCMYRSRGEHGYWVDPACFKHKESCYSLARLIPDSKLDDEHDIESVGSRPFNLDPKDLSDYLSVVKYSYEHWKELYNKDNEDDYLY